MKILNIMESREQCAEAGWYAYDYILDKPMDKERIISLRPLGSFTYLQMLKKPFYKVETDHYIIKGIEQDTFFRVAIHGDYMVQLEKIEHFIEEVN